jgi:hypothetical protein
MLLRDFSYRFYKPPLFCQKPLNQVEIEKTRDVTRVDTKSHFNSFTKYDYCFQLKVIIAVIATFFT